MITFDHELNEGHILALNTLRERLRQISSGAHQWEARLLPTPVHNRHNREYLYVAVGYTNPELPDLPNFLCYLFPAINNGIRVGLGHKVLVCIHPSAAIPYATGLYFDRAELKGDILEDWGRFWDPLEKVLDGSYTG